MNREEYLEKLRLALAQMPAEEKERQIAYYDELISDMCEDGMSETEATAKLGDPGKVAEELLAALPLGTLVKTRIKSAGSLSALAIVLLVLGFPLWRCCWRCSSRSGRWPWPLRRSCSRWASRPSRPRSRC